MTRIVTSIQANHLANGIKNILLDMKRDTGRSEFPVSMFERYIIEQHGVPKQEAEKVTEAVIATGILGWDIFGNNLVLLD
jgi:hypothetical protein